MAEADCRFGLPCSAENFELLAVAVAATNASSNNATNIGTGTTTAAVTIGNTLNTVTVAGGTNTVTGITNINTTGSAATNIGTSGTAGLVSLGGGSNQFAINTVNWDITNLGVASGLTGLTVGGATTLAGGIMNINASSNFATNIGTGTTTSAVNIGGAANSVVLGATNGLTIQANGHVNVVSTVPPTPGACGVPGVISAGSTDFSGLITMGTTSTVACVVNFGTAYTTAPFCVVALNTAAVAFQIQVTTTTLQMNTAAGAASRKYSWICVGL